MLPNSFEPIPANSSGSSQTLRQLCELGDVSTGELEHVALTGSEPLLATSFHVGVLAQSTIASAAYGASLFGKLRGLDMPKITVDMAAAERECTGYFMLDGAAPDSWAPLSGLYQCADGYVRIHANFNHHRDGACRLLGFSHSFDQLTQADLAQALGKVKSIAFEERAAAAGLPIYAQRSFAQWESTPQANWLRQQPLFTIKKIGEAPPKTLVGKPVDIEKPLMGVRVLDLTRILAGPVCGRTLALFGADVMLVNSPNLPNIAHVADTSRGKLSTFLDLTIDGDSQQLQSLVTSSHVFVQGYRPGGLSKLGFSPKQLAQISPGIVSVSLSAFGHDGPWSGRRGFDSLVQTATGFNHAEAQAFSEPAPRAFPIQILDFASGFLMSFASTVALMRQQREGGTWHVDVSLAQTAEFLKSLGRVQNNVESRAFDLPQYLNRYLVETTSGYGQLSYLPHSALLNGRTLNHERRSVLPGSDLAQWNNFRC